MYTWPRGDRLLSFCGNNLPSDERMKLCTVSGLCLLLQSTHACRAARSVQLQFHPSLAQPHSFESGGFPSKRFRGIVSFAIICERSWTSYCNRCLHILQQVFVSFCSELIRAIVCCGLMSMLLCMLEKHAVHA